MENRPLPRLPQTGGPGPFEGDRFFCEPCNFEGEFGPKYYDNFIVISRGPHDLKEHRHENIWFEIY